MGSQLSFGALRRGALLAICAATFGCAVSSAHAATVVPTSFTSCGGKLTPDSGGAAKKEPNLLDYSFSCDSGITAYSIIVTQQRDPSGAVDDFLGSPLVYETDNLTPSPTETVSCEGVLPSNGINCNTGAQGAQITDGYFVAGTIDPVQAYCKHLPTNSKGAELPAGFRAVPTARVQLIVTDYTGAEDGPFLLKPSKACPSVPNRVPPVTTTTTKARKQK